MIKIETVCWSEYKSETIDDKGVVTVTQHSKYIAQTEATKALSLYREINLSEPILALGPSGFGKSDALTRYGRSYDVPRIRIKCSASTTKKALLGIALKYMHDRSSVVFLDEAHNLPDSGKELLVAITPEHGEKLVNYTLEDGVIYNIDYSRCKLLLATNYSEDLPPALQNRFCKVEFGTYTKAELLEIAEAKTTGLRIAKSVLEKVVEIGRDCPRDIVSHIQKIVGKLATDETETNQFTVADWQRMSEQLSIRPLGLRKQECALLARLHDCGKQSLAGLASALIEERKTVQRGIEPYLIRHNLMAIDGQREITPAGVDMVKRLRHGGFIPAFKA